ncbi:MAG: hypothetical protein NC187_08665 [Candidatus Amulumruptor caecigallinarius]|nr:hypothetical protein [Candidatus Amulumruptor caecigallinarius]MCM1397540.1 hypothetical protein [Candidatus Amulumruptor caecigallinarius]MCM1454442.1 hypothetical protein [bacterium]
MNRPLRAFAGLATACFAAMCSAGAFAASDLYARPDFAYPRTVESDSREQLSKATDSRAMLRALLNLSLAETAISTDNIPAVTERIAALRAKESDRATAALLDLLLAQVYTNVYTSERSKYDERPVTTAAAGSDYRTWTGAQMTERITSLLASALSAGDALSAPVTTMQGVIEYQPEAVEVYKPTLLDFTADRAAAIYERLGRANEASRKALNALLTKMVEANASNPAEQTLWELRRMNSEADNALTGNDGDSDSRFARLATLFDRTIGLTPAAAEVVVAMDPYAAGEAERKRMYAAAESVKSRYPGYFRIGAVDDILAALAAGRVNIQAPLTVYPGMPMVVTANVGNVSDYVITLWKLPEGVTVNQSNLDPAKVKGIKLIREYPCTASGNVPFTAKSVTEVTIDKPGYYSLTVSYPGQSTESAQQNMRVVTCTKLAPFDASLESHNLYVVDGFSGKPQKGVNVFNYHRPDMTWVSTKLGATDAEGGFALPAGVKSFVYARSGSDISNPVNLWGGVQGGKYPIKEWRGEGFTSLPLYHPGDSVEWAGVFYVTEGYALSLTEGQPVTVALRDANYEEITSVEAVTDHWGRVSGTFTLPADRLPGTFTLYMTLREHGEKGKKGKILATVYTPLEVSDYKLPTYQVTLEQPRPDATGSYLIKGRLDTYTGMVLGGCEVNLNLSSDNARFCWWSSQPSLSFYTAKTTSAADGTFEFAVADSVLASAPYPRGVFTAAVTAVSPSGESQRATAGFAKSKLCLLSVTLPGNAELGKPVVPNAFTLTDVNGKPLTADVRYRVYLAGKESTNDSNGVAVATGTFSSAAPSLDLAALTPGRYEVKLDVPSIPDSEPVSAGIITLYSLAKGAQSPTDAAVWTPQQRITTPNDGKATIHYGTPAGESHVLLTIYDPANSKVKERRWLKSSGGMTDVDVKLPAGLDHATVSLYSIRDFKSGEASVWLTRKDSERKLRLVTTTLRDRTEPQATDTWRFRLEYEDGTPVEGAVMMDMYSKALDKLRKADFSFATSPGVLDIITYNAPYRGTLHASAWSNVNHAEFPQLTLPDWQLWGRSLTGGTIRIRGTYANAQMKMSSAPMMAKAESGEGEIDLMAVNEMKEEVEVAVAESADAATDTGSGTPGTVPTMPDIDYRPSEIPLALFKPLLVTDAQGNLEMEVTLPNAVTTWQLDVVAFTRDLLTASAKRTIVASKPLMVQPNLPRFVRSGDRLELLSSVYNKTDSALTACVRAEAIDMTSGRVVATGSSNVTVTAGASQTVGVPVEVKLPGGSMLQLKVSAQSGTFTDGEMATIPVLTSAASVIESQPFYIHTDSASVNLAIEPAPADAMRTLQYCDNPLWLCVLALPTLSEANATSATEAASNLLMSLVAKNVVERYPAIRDAIKEWSESDRGDSTLTSMLERNPQLKQLMLAATPWVRQARSDSERMSRLTLLLSGDNADKAATQAIAKLRELQQPDGGWRWLPQSTVTSEWATERVLTLIGALNEMGWMPDDREFNDMTRRAVEYVDSLAAERYRKYPQSSFISYALLREAFSYTESRGAHQASLAALREARAGWKNYGTVMKARVALLLENHGYGDIGREALASLTEYAMTSPERGMWWEGVDLLGQTHILRTYFVLKSRGSEVDAIRQWIIFQKEATDWGNTPDASLIVAGLLTTSPTWIAPSKDVKVEIDGKPLEVERADYGSGFFTQPIAATAAQLTISHERGLPSWGAVVSRYEQTATDVKAHSIPDLSIEKAILVADPKASAAGQNWTESTTMQLGSEVTIQLTVKAGRDMDYVTIVDERASCFEPAEQLPSTVLSQGLGFYMVPGDSDTRIFIDRLPKGTYVLTYKVSANNAGHFAGGIATVQSQMTPSLTAHSSGAVINVNMTNLINNK